MVLPSINSTFNLSRSIIQAREQSSDLQRQLATGKLETTYGGLGTERTQSLSFRSELSQIEGYKNIAQTASLRLEVAQVSLSQFRELTISTKTDSLGGAFDLDVNGQTLYQTQTRARFDDLISTLNTEVSGRYIFSGREVDKPPVLSSAEILDGAGGKAGFRQIASERYQADLGASGRGRLDIPAAAAGVVSIAEDAAPSPFGFKINAVNNTLTGTNITGPAGSPASVDVTFTATLPQDGETISVSLDLPDGTQKDITLAAVSGTPQNPGEFQIGADENATAVNFQTALTARVEEEAQTSLKAASLYEAADNFFDFDPSNPPQRVDGPPFDSATALRDATATDTIVWYEGELSTSSARDSAIAKVDDSIIVSHGLRANEDAFRTSLKSFAVLSTATFSTTDPLAANQYDEVKNRANTELGFPSGTQSIDHIISEITVAQAAIGSAVERHDASSGLLDQFVSEIEDADIYEVSSQLLALQSRLQASYQVTATLGSLSLANFL